MNTTGYNRIVIVTIPGMITEPDWKVLEDLGSVEYVEKDHVTTEELLTIIKDKDYLLLNRDVVVDLDDTFYSAVKSNQSPLKAISADYTDMSWAHPEIAKRYGITLLNTPNYSTISVAEFTMASLLLHVKKIRQVLNTNKVEWLKNDVLFGKTLGIIGLGNIGIRVAQLAVGFDMNVIGWNRTPKNVPNVKAVSLEDVFRLSDYISIHVKTTKETTCFINKEYLTLAKTGVVIVNQADPAIINNDDLLELIDSKKLEYNTFTEKGFDHPIKNHENVTILPMQGWFTEDSLQRLRKIWVGNIVDAMHNIFTNQVL